ncbi:MAG: glutamine--fructose-6-phosphate transaminase (isomerizing) [Clostridia bacterium]|nr:glutamine--fructose-6-phosphate transaminase (isomerizing) [Clostridia bacterium]
MCGIVGYIGKNAIDKQLVENLKQLEYRGYDSAGLSILLGDEIKTIKAEGKISNLESLLDDGIYGSMGIAHTRWATHGMPNETNAHPHVSTNGKWAIVHNGIIENFEKLKNYVLKNQEIKYVSDTDSEVIVQMFQNEYNGNIMDTIIRTCNKLEGSFALAVMYKSVKDAMFLAKRKSPLYVAIAGDEVFVASDPICFAGKAEKYYSLDDDEFCEVSTRKIVFFNKERKIIEKKLIELDFDKENYEKKECKHFMLKEIKEVPEVLARIKKTYLDSRVFDKIDQEVLKGINKVLLVGCGTAYHAAMLGASMIERSARIEAKAVIASEFRYADPIIDERTLAIFVSQSGETADTLMAEVLAKQKGAKTIALTNVLYSSLAKSVDYILPVCAGPEIAVASTKAYTAQITILNMFTKHLSNILHNKAFDYIADLDNLIRYDYSKIEDEIAKISGELKDINKTVFFIGRLNDYITSLEASLKLKEITYINSQSYPAGELKHGYLALVEEGSIVFVIATEKVTLEKTINAANEAAARGGKIVLISQFDIPKDKINNLYSFIKLDYISGDLMPIVSIYPFQKLAYLTSVIKGLNPDQPRNLAKSVTVE